MLNANINEKEENDYVLKLVIFGPPRAGKTSLALRMAENEYFENYHVTIGLEFRKIINNINGLRVKTLLWDLPGEEKFRKMISPIYFKKTSGVFLAFDIANENSFQEVQQIQRDIKELLEINTPIILIGCKNDLNEQRQVEQDVVKEFANKMKLQYIETSAKTGYNCDFALRQLQESGLQFRKNEVESILIDIQKDQGYAQNKCF